jgi:hypothetical protein
MKKKDDDPKFIEEMNTNEDPQFERILKYLLAVLPKNFKITKDEAKRVIIDCIVSETLEGGLAEMTGPKKKPDNKKPAKKSIISNGEGYTWSLGFVRPLSCFTYTSVKDPEFQQAWALMNLIPIDNALIKRDPYIGGKTLYEWKAIILDERDKPMIKKNEKKATKKTEKKIEPKLEEKTESEFDDKLIDELVDRFLDMDAFQDLAFDLNDRYDHPDNYIDNACVAFHIALDVIHDCDVEMMAEMDAEIEAGEAAEDEEKKETNKDLN